MDGSELDSFITKFKQLRQLGLEAHLDAKAGQAWVGLRVHQQEQFGHHPRGRTRNTPSRLRCRARRTAERQEQQQNQKVISNDDIEENEANAKKEQKQHLMYKKTKMKLKLLHKHMMLH